MTFDTRDPNPGRASWSTEEALPGYVQTLPMVPAMRRRVRRTLEIVNAGFLCAIAFFGCIIVIVGLRLWPAILASGMSTAMAGVIIAVVTVSPYAWLHVQVARQLRAGTFHRYNGNLVVRRHVTRSQTPSNGDGPFPKFDPDDDVRWTLVLPDSEAGIGADVAAAVQRACLGQVDYAPHLGLIFEIRDGTGQVLYRPAPE